MTERDSTSRYDDRARDYARHRPGYPVELREALISGGHLRAGDTVADVGSGTGLLSELLLSAGCRVLAIEPNAGMREQAESRFGGESRFVSVAGRAEATTLPDVSVDLVAAGQAFHWFDPDAARVEFLRILRPPAHALLVWNVRRTDAGPFMAECEHLLLAHATDPKAVVGHVPDQPALARFFGGQAPQPLVFHHHQMFADEGLSGRLLSASFVPGPSDPGRDDIIEAIHALFARHQKDGVVRFDYETRAYAGILRQPPAVISASSQ